MSFPSSPSNNQVVVVNNITYEYNSTSHTWTRVQVPVSANLIGANNIVVSNALTGGNVYATAFYWANGTPFASSTYGNTDVAAYLPTYTGNLTSGNVSAGGYYWANGAPFLSSSYGNTDVAAYLPIYTGNITANNITTTGNIVGGGVRNTAGTTAPVNPFPGDTWYDTDNDTLLRYTNDGDSYQWIDISGIMVGEIPSTYGDANVAVYLPTSSVITGINANVAGANAAIITANSAVVSYVNTLNTAMAANVAGANAAIITANSALKSYVDTLNTAMASNVAGANAAIVTANSAVVSYVNTLNTAMAANVAGANASILLRANIASPTFTGTVTVANIVTTDGLFWSNGTAFSSGSGGISSARSYGLSVLFGTGY